MAGLIACGFAVGAVVGANLVQYLPLTALRIIFGGVLLYIGFSFVLVRAVGAAESNPATGVGGNGGLDRRLRVASISAGFCPAPGPGRSSTIFSANPRTTGDCPNLRSPQSKKGLSPSSAGSRMHTTSSPSLPSLMILSMPPSPAEPATRAPPAGYGAGRSTAAAAAPGAVGPLVPWAVQARRADPGFVTR